jgi:hypothetical protein
MADVLAGILIVLIGAVFCFRGYLAMRFVLPVWGLLVGFSVGAGLIAAITGDGFLSTAIGWIVGIVLALIFAALSYLYYEVAVILSLGFVGFTITAAVMAAIGISWSWLIFIVGVAVGLVVALAALVLQLPMVLLVVLTALGGASAMVSGLLLVFNRLDLEDFDNATITDNLDGRPLWTAIWIVLAIAGAVAQLKWINRVEQNMAAQWDAQGGRRLAS